MWSYRLALFLARIIGGLHQSKSERHQWNGAERMIEDTLRHLRAHAPATVVKIEIATTKFLPRGEISSRALARTRCDCVFMQKLWGRFYVFEEADVGTDLVISRRRALCTRRRLRTTEGSNKGTHCIRTAL
ncbi:hypothetical protein NDU88_000994 [Pleurodeles waltl]|uniref:Secreted protein n=1 Tax=Pleurodeles waltl TaxID=8319 RepID=A0AAV7N9P3_PLEWA|nr:hypothetical protein NDU88_000994 [Pleurodeles waltl]